MRRYRAATILHAGLASSLVKYCGALAPSYRVCPKVMIHVVSTATPYKQMAVAESKGGRTYSDPIASSPLACNGIDINGKLQRP